MSRNRTSIHLFIDYPNFDTWKWGYLSYRPICPPGALRFLGTLKVFVEDGGWSRQAVNVDRRTSMSLCSLNYWVQSGLLAKEDLPKHTGSQYNQYSDTMDSSPMETGAQQNDILWDYKVLFEEHWAKLYVLSMALALLESITLRIQL